MPLVSLFCKQAATLHVPFSICPGNIHIKIAYTQGIFYCVQDAGITACNYIKESLGTLEEKGLFRLEFPSYKQAFLFNLLPTYFKLPQHRRILS